MFPYDFEGKDISFFIGRKAELTWLDKHLAEGYRRHYPIFITGSGGIGKTALVKYWLSTRTAFSTPLWLNLSHHSNIDTALINFINHLSIRNKERFPNGEQVNVVIDEGDLLDLRQQRMITDAIFNYKMVSSLIFIRRTPMEVFRSPHLALKPLPQSESLELLQRLLPKDDISNSQLLEIVNSTEGYPLAISLISKLIKKENYNSISSVIKDPLYDVSKSLSLPESEIITTISPIIVSANENLVELLKKQPNHLRNISPRDFEKLLAELLKDMGWEVELTKQTKDGGADILAYLNTNIGRLLCLVEAKHYREDRKVGVDLVRTLYGTLCDAQANSAMLVTTSTFTPDAKEFQKKHKYQLTLSDYADVVTWIMKYGNR